MFVAEKLLTEAIDHLDKARQTMRNLAGCTADRSAGLQVEIEFQGLEETCREFGQCQFGLPPR